MSPKVVPGFARPRRSHGFTLVELLVVIGIIAILIGLLVTIIPKIRKAAYGASTSAQLSAISNAIQQYYGDYKAYPGPLGNNQLGCAYAPTGTWTLPYSPNVTNPALQGENGVTFTTGQSGALGHITGAQNLVLGLLGGLEVQYSNGVPTNFYYNPLDLFPDGSHPGPVGAASLNPNNPRRQQSYIQVKQGEISLPSMSYNNGNGASFADAANRSPSDAPMAVFLDKWPDPMPILYIRANVGGTAIVGVRNTDDGGAQLVDPTTGYSIVENPQYDLCQVFDYTKPNSNIPSPSITGWQFSNGFFGVIYTSTSPYHGLQGLGNQSLSSPPSTRSHPDTPTPGKTVSLISEIRISSRTLLAAMTRPPTTGTKESPVRRTATS